MNDFVEFAKKEGLEIDDKIIESLNIFLKELLEWNNKFNLTAIKDPEEIWHKHFIDSVSVLKSIPKNALKVIDVGTGAGFPGLVVKILNPKLHITLLEATGKKVSFLKHIVNTLDLKYVETLQNRAEILANHPNYRENFDIVLSRAVAYMPTLLEYCLPFLKIGGIFIAQKKEGEEELTDSKNAIEVLGGEIIEIKKLEFDKLSPRQIVIIKKVKETPKEYPRGEGLSKKRPL